MDESHFLDRALGTGASTWDRSSLEDLARLQVPDSVLGRQKSLVRADINEQWARWFVESLADPRHYAKGRTSYPQIFSDILRMVDMRFGHFTRPQRQELASSAAKITKRLAEQFSSSTARKSIPLAEKKFLLGIAGEPPRCWICGGSFSEEAIENYLFQAGHIVPQPAFIDVLKPRGLIARDLNIEIDHVLPFSRGGDEENNLALACGWCNRHKSDYSSIYDIEGRPREAGTNDLGINSLPQPFWTVRILATVRTCEHPDGCNQSSDNSNLTISPLNACAAMNPANLHVTCYIHDPLRNVRLQSARIVSKLWGGS